MNQEFQAQTAGKIALDRFRREGHAACRVDPAGPTNAITLDLPDLGGLHRLRREAGELVHGRERVEPVWPLSRCRADLRLDRRSRSPTM